MRAQDSEQLEPRSLPRYQRAARHAAQLFNVLLGAGGLVLGLLALGWMFPAWRGLVASQAAIALVLLAGLHAAWRNARWRARALLAAPQQRPPGQRARWYLRWRGRLQNLWNHPTSAALISAALVAVALWFAFGPWQGRTPADAPQTTRLAIAAGLVLLAFAALVLERFYTFLPADELPEATPLAHLLRVHISVSLLLCGALLLLSPTRLWPGLLAAWLAWLPAALGLELLARACLTFFGPPRAEPGFFGESLLAALWRWPPRPLSDLQDELKLRFGIDLRQSWAFAYIRRALVPVLSVLLACAWLLSGLSEIPLAARGIYERFGKPVAVWQPGLHVGLPWPLGRVEWVENGVVHELAAAGGEDDAKPEAEQLASAEGPPPSAANRLWDASHVAENSQVIAGAASAGKQSFQIVNMDVRFLYRVGLSDAAALKARYQAVDTEVLIRSTAKRILVGYFAARTLDGVLGEQRAQMAAEIGAQVQSDLDRLNSGVEIMATVVEAIHPPAAAANAYHAVQAAQISALAIIARERGRAAEQVNLAQLRAALSLDGATASAREIFASAEAGALKFTAQHQAHQQGGDAFLFEQYLARLSQGLGDAALLLVDHRLPSANTLIDLRKFALRDPAIDRLSNATQ